jgi:hypothetical protein
MMEYPAKDGFWFLVSGSGRGGQARLFRVS